MGSFGIALSLAVIARSLILSDPERHLKLFVERYQLEQNMKDTAAKIIQQGNLINLITSKTIAIVKNSFHEYANIIEFICCI